MMMHLRTSTKVYLSCLYSNVVAYFLLCHESLKSNRRKWKWNKKNRFQFRIRTIARNFFSLLFAQHICQCYCYSKNTTKKKSYICQSNSRHRKSRKRKKNKTYGLSWWTDDGRRERKWTTDPNVYSFNSTEEAESERERESFTKKGNRTNKWFKSVENWVKICTHKAINGHFCCLKNRIRCLRLSFRLFFSLSSFRCTFNRWTIVDDFRESQIDFIERHLAIRFRK